MGVIGKGSVSLSDFGLLVPVIREDKKILAEKRVMRSR